ncbi:MAG TPA: tRNA epoxyqueuosine(34) reductase QueG [Terriglobia bacterium]|nr:tRNA epoxyqueuosine(34) reductase QueG [Terriglobia bacterium]
MLRTGLSKQIRVSALEAGFDLAGVAPLAAWQDLEFAKSWAEKGYGGEMAYLRNPKRADPRLILPSAQSVVCVGLVYNTALPYSTEALRDSGSGTRGAGFGVRDSGFGTRKTGFGVRNSGFETQCWRQRSEATLPASPNYANRTHAQVSDAGSRTPKTEHRTPTCESRGPSPEPRAWISRYAWGRDYHQVMRSRLERLRTAIENLAPDVETRVYVDTGPIVERAFARLSGIGWVGKNTCLINQQRGSWFFLGVILTSLELEADAPAFDRCGSCTRCLDACPTGALIGPYVMDASRCIAYLNIELKGLIPEELRPAIGANVFGCDICQDVCPWNGGSSFVVRSSLGQPETPESKLEIRVPRRRAAETDRLEFHPLTVEGIGASHRTIPQTAGEPQTTADHEQRTTNHELQTNDDGQRTTDEGQRTTNHELRTFSLFNPRLEDLASLTEDDFRRIFRDSPIKRTKHRGWVRNLCVVMGNSGDTRFIPWLEQTAREHEDAVVREHAEWALLRLGDPDGPEQ